MKSSRDTMAQLGDRVVRIYYSDLTDEAKEVLREAGIEPSEHEAPLAIRPRQDFRAANRKT